MRGGQAIKIGVKMRLDTDEKKPAVTKNEMGKRSNFKPN